MATFIRSPFAITAALKQLPKQSTTSTTSRAFHQFITPATKASLQSIRSAIKAQKPTSIFTKSTSRSTSRLTASNIRQAFRRSYHQPAQQNPYNPEASREWRSRLLYGAAIFGGTVIATNLVFNRETREDGGMPPYERSYLNETFVHTGLGIGIIGITARALYQSGMVFRVMSANPWVVIIGGLGLSIGTMMGTRAIAPENYIPKYACWAAFNATQALVISPLLFMSPALLARAGLYTIAMMGSIAFVGATAKTDKYLYLGGPLLAGVAIVAVSGLAPLVLPATAIRTLAWTENIWLWGGLAVFGGFTLYDVQKILHHARMAERGLMKRDAVNESISLELDFLNIFIRMVQIMGMQQRRK